MQYLTSKRERERKLVEYEIMPLSLQIVSINVMEGEKVRVDVTLNAHQLT